MAVIEVHNIGRHGVMRDLAPPQLPPEAWSSSQNVRFFENNAYKFTGNEQVFGTPPVAPGFIINVPGLSQNYWLYASLTKIYNYEGGSHTNITRQTASADVDYAATEYRQWNGTILGGIPILNNGIDVPQFWPAVSSSSKMEAVTDFPADTTALIIRAFGPFLVLLNVTTDGDHYPHMFWWSHPAEVGALPASWDVTDPARDTGRRELTDIEGGVLLEGLMLRNYFIMYKETSTHLMRYVGGQAVMANDQIFTSSGILAARHACAFDKGRKHFVVTQDDVITHNGQEIEGILEARYKRQLFRELDPTNFRNGFVAHNPASLEVWYAYPSQGNTLPNRALVWNYKYDTIQFRDFAGTFASAGTAQIGTSSQWDLLENTWDDAPTAWAVEGNRQFVAGYPSVPAFQQMDTGDLFGSSQISAYIERLGLAVIGRDRNGQPKLDMKSNRLVKRLWPKMSGSGIVNIRVGMQDENNGPVTWQTPQAFDAATGRSVSHGYRYLDFECFGRLPAVRFESNGAGSWCLEGYDVDIEPISEE